MMEHTTGPTERGTVGLIEKVAKLIIVDLDAKWRLAGDLNAGTSLRAARSRETLTWDSNPRSLRGPFVVGFLINLP